MKNSDPPTYFDRERETLLSFALSVCLDPSSPPEHVQQAQRRLSEPSPAEIGQVLAAQETWVLHIIRALCDENDPLRERLRELVGGIVQTPDPAP
jgi:hypothetical protein